MCLNGRVPDVKYYVCTEGQEKRIFTKTSTFYKITFYKKGNFPKLYNDLL